MKTVKQCNHGHLKRQCLICELMARIEELEAENERLEKGLKNAMEMIIKLRELLAEDEK